MEWSLLARIISIPSGAIKRLSQNPIFSSPYNISIPSGAIKRTQA